VPKRAVFATLAWVAATATAMAVVWTGLDAVLPVAAEGPRVAPVAAWPEQAATTGLGTAPVTTPPPPVTAPVRTSSSAAAPGTTPPAARTTVTQPSPTQPSTTPAGVRRLYSSVGGTVVLTLFPNSAVLDAATPATGYSVQRFVESAMVEVVFTPVDGGTVYEVIATWNGTSPQVQTDAVGG
jgi:hypothetical protein